MITVYHAKHIFVFFPIYFPKCLLLELRLLLVYTQHVLKMQITADIWEKRIVVSYTILLMRFLPVTAWEKTTNSALELSVTSDQQNVC